METNLRVALKMIHRLGYIRGGFQQMYDAFGERIRALGGTVLTGAAATSIRTRDGCVEVQLESGQMHQFQCLAYSMTPKDLPR